jgi:hypothetical protein
MNRHNRDLLRLLQTEASVYGAAVWIEPTNGGHLRAVFSLGANRVFTIISRSPSVRRSHLHVRADARRALRNLTTA